MDQIQTLLGAIEPNERERFIDDIEATHQELAKLIDLAWESDQQGQIPDLVDLIWPANQAVSARMLWRDLELTELSEHQRNANVPLTKTGQDKWEAVVDLELQNKDEAAFESAFAAENFERAYSIAINASRWDLAFRAASEMNTRNPATTRKTGPRLGGPNFRLQGLAMSAVPSIATARSALLLEWSGDHDAAEQHSKAIPDVGEGKLDLSAGLTTRVLLGRIDEAVEIAKTRDQDQAYETLLMQGKVNEAFATLGWTDWSSDGVQKWLDQALKEKPANAGDEYTRTHRLVDLSCTLHRLGATELCEQVDNAVLYWLSGAGMDDAQNGRHLDRSLNEVVRDRWTVAIDAWNREHRRPYAFRQFEQLLRERIDDEQQNRILQVLDAPKASRISWGSLAPRVFAWLQDQRASFRQEKRLNASASSSDDFAHLGEALRDFDDLAYGRSLKDWPVDWNRLGIRQLGRTILTEAGVEDRSIVSRQLAEIALELNRHDLLEEWLAVGASKKYLTFQEVLAKGTMLSQPIDFPLGEDNDDIAKVELLCRSLFARREYQRAGAGFDILWRNHPDRLDFALEHAACLEACGAFSEAARVRDRVMSFPMFPQLVSGFARELEQNERYDEATQLLRHTLRIGERDLSGDWPYCFMLRSVEGKIRSRQLTPDKPLDLDAIPILKNALFTQRRECLSRLDAFPTRSFELQWDVIAYDLQWRSYAALAIAEGNFEEADKAIRMCHRAWPEQIETPLELVPWGREKFGAELAQTWIDLYADPLEQHMTRWPNDTLIGNNLAWLYANLEWKLERAEELSRRFAKGSPMTMFISTHWRKSSFVEATKPNPSN